MFTNDSFLQTLSNISGVGDSNGTSRERENIRMPNTHMKIAFGTIAALGILGNLIVIVVISKSSNMRKSFTNILILNQSSIDFMASMFSMISTMTRSPVSNLSGISGEIYCRFWLSDLPLWTSVISSSYALIVLTVERYVAIVHPIYHHYAFSMKKVFLMAASSWIPGIVVIMCFLVPTSGVVDGRCLVMSLFYSSFWKKVCGVFLFIFQYLIPIVVFITCYTKIFICLRTRVQPAAPPNPNEATSQKARARRNVLKTLITIVLCYIMCNSWNQFLFLSFNFGYHLDYKSTFYNFTVIAMFTNSCINPFIYALKYEIFQKEFRKIFFKCETTTTNDTTP